MKEGVVVFKRSEMILIGPQTDISVRTHREQGDPFNAEKIGASQADLSGFSERTKAGADSERIAKQRKALTHFSKAAWESKIVALSAAGPPMRVWQPCLPRANHKDGTSDARHPAILRRPAGIVRKIRHHFLHLSHARLFF